MPVAKYSSNVLEVQGGTEVMSELVTGISQDAVVDVCLYRITTTCVTAILSYVFFTSYF